MSFRDAIKRGGGGFFSGDGTLVDYEFNTRDTKKGTWVQFVPQVQFDGVEGLRDQNFFLGSEDDYEISDDGKSVTMKDGENVSFGESTGFGKLMDSLCTAAEKAGLELEKDLGLPKLDEGEALNLESLIDRRFRLKQVVDEKATEKFGKRKATKGKHKGKEFDRTNSIIEAILGETKGAKKAAGKPAGKKSAKDEDADGDDADDSLNDEAEAVLRDIIDNSKGPMYAKNLSVKASQALLKNKNKDALRKLILDSEFRDTLSWLKEDKKGVLTIDE